MSVVDVSWMDHYASATIKIFWNDTKGEGERRTEIKAHEWKEICDRVKTLEEGTYISLRGASLCDYDPQTGWFDLYLEEFTVSGDAGGDDDTHIADTDGGTDVTFEFKDILNFWWVSGMRWDYVELRPMDWFSYKPISA